MSEPSAAASLGARGRARALTIWAGGRLRVVQWFVTAGIVVVAALLTAFTGLLVEGWWPAERHDPGAQIVTEPFWSSRLGATMACLILLGGLAWWRRWLVRRRGTLYYVRLLDLWMKDQHREPLQVAMGAYVDSRVIHRRTHQRPHDGVLDWTADVAGLGGDLQRSMNDDTLDTGYQVALNMLWPAATALAYDWHTWQPSTLEDFGPGGSLVSWRVPDSKSPPAWQGAQPRPWWLRPPQGEPVRSILVTAYLTSEQERGMMPVPLDTDGVVAVGVVSPHDADRDEVALPAAWVSMDALSWAGKYLQVQGVAPRHGRRTLPSSIAETQRDGFAQVHPYDATRVLAQTVQRLLHAYPQATLVLSLKVMKTVAFGLGVWLANEPAPCQAGGCQQPSCLYPWSRLLPVLFPQGQAEVGTDRTVTEPMITLVHPGQPNRSRWPARLASSGSTS